MKAFVPIPEEVERVGRVLLEAGMEVHRSLGPGFIERIYEEALCHELTLRNTSFERQKTIEVFYKNVSLGEQRIDLVINDMIIVELKAVEKILPIHEAQLLSYLKATNLRLGFILNFNVPLFKNGIRRMVL
ncbi:MAG: GxxExxY protein [Anaerolineae bacterium]|nr:GxxExxY protein [Anaerolineae bacterium]